MSTLQKVLLQNYIIINHTINSQITVIYLNEKISLPASMLCQMHMLAAKNQPSQVVPRALVIRRFADVVLGVAVNTQSTKARCHNCIGTRTKPKCGFLSNVHKQALTALLAPWLPPWSRSCCRWRRSAGSRPSCSAGRRSAAHRRTVARAPTGRTLWAPTVCNARTLCRSV